jgi:hypothetical protein
MIRNRNKKAPNYVCACGRAYTHRQGLYTHRKTCAYIKEPQAQQQQNNINMMKTMMEFMKQLQAEVIKTENMGSRTKNVPTTTGCSRKNERIYSWKKKGIIANDWNTIYDRYVNTDKCDFCEKFIDGITKHLEHNHYITNDENIRGIVCPKCNTIKRIEDNFKENMFNRLKFAVRISKSVLN